MCIMLSISKVRNTIAFFLIIEHYGGGWQTHNSRSQVSDVHLFPYWWLIPVREEKTVIKLLNE